MHLLRHFDRPSNLCPGADTLARNPDGIFFALGEPRKATYLGGITHTATWDAGLGEEEVYHLS